MAYVWMMFFHPADGNPQFVSTICAIGLVDAFVDRTTENMAECGYNLIQHKWEAI